MNFGNFELFVLSDGMFWLDGGAMFGVVPKVLWNKLSPADELNRIKLALNCLLIITADKKIVVDTGIGDKLKDRFKEMYRIERRGGLLAALNELGIKPEEIDFVVNTHLHFDHCGGNTSKRGGSIVSTFPNALYVIQQKEYQDALNPNERTRASYLPENFVPVEKNNQIKLVHGDYELVPGIKLIATSGHTRGHQSVLIDSGNKKAIYFGDLIPTASHLRIPYVMGYDLYPLEVIAHKKKLLQKAAEEAWLLIFEHDPKSVFGYLEYKDGKPVLKSL